MDVELFFLGGEAEAGVGGGGGEVWSVVVVIGVVRVGGVVEGMRFHVFAFAEEPDYYCDEGEEEGDGEGEGEDEGEVGGVLGVWGRRGRRWGS